MALSFVIIFKKYTNQQNVVSAIWEISIRLSIRW